MALVALALSVSVAPAAASAAQRYAEPSGDGPAATCPAVNPCDIQVAVENAAVLPDDEVIVLEGDYALTNPLTVSESIHVHGAAGQARPQLTRSGGVGVEVANSGAKLSRMGIESDSTTLYMSQAGTAEAVVARSTNGSAFACLSQNATLRDSVCWNSGANGTALNMNGSGAAQSHTTTIRNVTAVAAGTSSTGISVGAGGSVQLTLDGKNVIADGSVDVSATATSPASATINLSYSNFATRSTSGTGASATDPSTSNNQTAAPVFVNAAAGDFHQTSTSLGTIDLGTVTAQNGTTDFEGEARTSPPAIDIGADEYTDTDGDLDPDYLDNCPTVVNPDQANNDGDSQGDACDTDDDNDGDLDGSDNCQFVANADQANHDPDAQGDACDTDDDNDGDLDGSDNCQFDANADQANTDGDSQGNVCDNDDDGDGVTDGADACPTGASAGTDTDGDGCKNAGEDSDDDGDGVTDGGDACPTGASAGTDTDGDGCKDAEDPDDDNDTVADGTDNCPTTSNTNQANNDGDSSGDVCDSDDDNDGVGDASDACPTVAAATANGCPAEGGGEFARSLTISYSQSKQAFKGKLASGEKRCIDGQKVTVFEKRAGRDPKVASDASSATGGYLAKERHPDGRYYAKVGETDLAGAGACLAGKSRSIKVG